MKTSKSQMMERLVTIRKIGRRIGTVMLRNTWKPLAPSTSALSTSSDGTWERPAKRVMAAKGRAPQITTMAITVNPSIGRAYQLWWMKFPSRRKVSSQLTTPNS